MARNDKHIHEVVQEELETIQLKTFVKWNRKVCGTAITALFAFGTMVGNWIMNHSERAYAAMHVLIFGELPR